MGMQLQIGSSLFRVGEAAVTVDNEYELDGKGEPWLKIENWTIELKMLKDFGDLDTQISAYETLCESTQSLIGLLDNGVPTATYVTASEALGGIRCTKPPSYNKYQGGEYVTYRTVSSTWQVVKPLYTSATQIIDFQESCPQLGVDNSFGILQPNYGRAVFQQLRQYKASTFTQTGSITYAGTYGSIPDPLFSVGQIGAPEINVNPPRRLGSGNYTSYIAFTIDYTYQFESPTTLKGLPTQWV